MNGGGGTLGQQQPTHFAPGVIGEEGNGVEMRCCKKQVSYFVV
jgi:hypothetical protein